MSTAFEHVSIDTVRAYWDRRPCNVRHSRAPLGSLEYFEQVAARRYFVEPHIPHFAEFSRWNGARVLEVGCGIGTDTVQFAKAGATVTAVDLSPESLALARDHARVYGVADRVTFIQGNSEELTKHIQKGDYDLVYSFGVVHHTPRPERAVAEIRQLLAPHGELRLMVYSRVSYKLFWLMHEEGTWDLSRIDEVIARNSEAQTGCPVTYTYSFEDVARLLAGFEVVDIRKAHIFTWEVDAYIRHEYVKDPAWARVSDAELAALEKELGWHTLVQARLSK
jgi:2-polyprenyl-3-methyl-5-hydroxy-6-metoxy-1,4-benzoquinol methylase